MFKVDIDRGQVSNSGGEFRESGIFCKRRTPLHLGSGVHGCGGGFEPPTFGLCDLTHGVAEAPAKRPAITV